MGIIHFLQQFAVNYKWASKDQKEGFLAFLQFVIRNNPKTDMELMCLMLTFIIQKDSESWEWQRDLMGNQIKSLEDQIRLLQK